MRRTTLSPAAALSAALIVTLIACEAEKSANPLSPAVAGPIPGVEITAPKLLEPQQGFRFKENQQPIRLLIENASSSGVRPLSYTFEVSGEAEFGTTLFARSGVTPGDGGRTSVQVDRLALGRAYYWRARAQDGANTGPFLSSQFEVLPSPLLTVPAAISPVNNERVTDRRPTLRIRNSDKNAAVGGVSYHFMIAKDQAFTQVAASAMINEENGETRWTADRDLDYNVTHFWRVRGTDGETTTDWMPTQVFRSPLAPSAPAPGPAPPAPGGPCVSSSAQTIVECERSKYGHMSASQTVDFLRATARSLNSNGISGGPFGILRKSGGSSCNGYSCDIICSGQGGGQRQWDVLGDAEGAQSPGWSGPQSGSGIRVDVCEIQ
jgi:hypothetical protein